MGVFSPGAGFKIPRKKLDGGETGEERAKEEEERARVLVKLRERIERKKEIAKKAKEKAAAEKRARDEVDKRKVKAEADRRKVKAEADRGKAKADADRRKDKAAAGKQAKAQASAKTLPKAGTREKARFLKASPPPPLRSREDVGVSVASIPAEAPKVSSAALLNPGVETSLGMIRRNGSGPSAGRKPRLTLMFKGKLVRSISQNIAANPPSGSVASRSPAVGLSLGFAAKTATAVAYLPSGREVHASAASKSKIRSRSLATAAGASTPVPASAAKSTPSLVSTTKRGLGRGKGKRGVAERKTPTVVKDGPFAPNGWGPKTTQEGTEWPKGALTVLNRLKRRDTLVNRDFLIKFPELDVGLTKEFTLPATEMAEYRALVGEPTVLSTLESRLREGYYRCPQHFVNEGLRIFTNSILWWGQERFRGHQYAGDVIMVCKHLRSIFRWHCLEMLPHWV